MMPTIYIAGPFRAATAWGIEQNIRHAEEWGLHVAEMGASPLIPHANTRYFHGTCSDLFWLEATMALLRICDAAFFIPGWKQSKGAVAEFEDAQLRQQPTFTHLHDLNAWIQSRLLDTD